MKKSLIALAVAGAFAAPAFADTANANLYGNLNVSIDVLDNGAKTNSRMSTNNTSEIGITGSEDLGGGMKAVWKLAVNPTVDNNNATGGLYGQRNSYVGLAGGFGTVLLGTHDSPYKMSTSKLDAFVGTIGDYNAIMGAAGATGASGLFDLRPSNVIVYRAPKIGGAFDVDVAYVMGGEAATPGQNKNNAWSASGTYANGPLFVTAAYEKHNNVNATVAASAGGTVLGAGAATSDRDAWKIGAGYAFGDLSLGLAYENIDGNGTESGKDHDAWMINAQYKMGAITLKAQYITADDLNNAANTGADLWAVGADYALSKRTKLQFTYANLDNNSAGAWVMGQGASLAPSAAGKSVDGFSLGMVHNF